MRGRPSIYAFYGIIPVHISRDVCSEEVGASHHRWLPDGPRTNVVVRGPYFFDGTANTRFLYLSEYQDIMKSCCSRSVDRSASLRTVSGVIAFDDAMSIELVPAGDQMYRPEIRCTVR